MEALKAAVSAGADAVYLGGAAFGARAYAKNLDEQEILSAIDYVHLRNRKLYLTVNTLLKEEELEEKLYPYLRPYYEQGLDAVIVQDMGVLKAVRSWFPDLDIHASTQMTVTGSAGARFLESLGATRVVPARELSFAEIQKIHRTTNLEIECFVHGALCYCYSGQCLFSSLIGGRSGNRGRCAQPCRLPYEAYDKDNHRMGEPGDRYPLSPKDMCTVELLPEIVKSGIMSLKIEGRMKKPEYTAGVVSIYRKYLDLYEKKPSRFHVLPEDMKKLYELYNRDGFNKSYYTVRNGRDMMALKNEKEQENKKKQRRNEQLFYEIQRDYIETEAKEPISGFLTLYPGQPAFLSAESGKYSVTAEAGMVEPAKKQPLTEERIRSQMEKLGNTEYEWENLEIQMDENIFIPMKMLNEARREALESLENELLKPYKREENNGKKRLSEDAGRKADSPKQKNLPIYISCEEKSTALALYKREGIHGMYLNADAMEVCLDDCVSRGMEMYLSLPHIMRGEMPRELLTRIREWMDRGMTGFLVRNLETFAVLRKAGLAEKCVLDHSMYTWNDEAADFWKDQKVLRNTVPLELNEGEIRHRDNRDSEMLIYGYLPLMISAQCVHKNLYGCNHKEEGVTLKDRYNKEFTAKCICNPWKTENTDFCIPCYNIIYNSIPYGLLKEKSQIDRLGVSSLRLAFTIEKPQDAVKIYEEFRAVYRDGKNPPKREYTKGHFKRGAE